MFYPGDCVDVGKQSALRWIHDGAARPLQPRIMDEDMTGCGVVLVGDSAAAARLREAAPKLAVSEQPDYRLSYPRTLLLVI